MNQKWGPVVHSIRPQHSQNKYFFKHNMAQEYHCTYNSRDQQLSAVKFIQQATIITLMKTQHFRSRDRRKTQPTNYAITLRMHRTNKASQQILLKGNEMGGTCGKNERYRAENSRE
jgi:hypothetical protein